jgi:pilus assembly protein Flp/PilA
VLWHPRAAVEQEDAVMAKRERNIATAVVELSRFAGRELGQGLAEYSLILTLVALVVVGALISLGGSIGGPLNTVTALL